MTLRERQDYEVILQVTSEIKYIINARTPEEAEGEAEALLEEGERPVHAHIIESVVLESYPSKDEAIANSDATGHF